ncbi:MAG TPA: cellulase family glycosylhydrolase [Actinospica sp.]|nr:cellulase family glycosylhydrolase [Actinospica sp.]
MKSFHRTARPGKRRLGLLAGAVATLVTASFVVAGTAFATHPATTAAKPASPSSASASAAPANALQFGAAIQPGWNLGNSLDAVPNETAWGNPATTKALIDKVKSLGFRSIRIPVTWSNHQGSAPGYTVDPAYLTRVKQVVDWALADGLYVVLNVHHDSWQWISSMPSNPNGVLARFNATWTQIAAEFKGESNKLVLESVNEPTFTGASTQQIQTLLNELNTDFVHLVRGTGGGNATRYLLLPTPIDTPSKPLMDNLAATIQSLHDTHLIASVHYYGYWPFSVNVADETTFDSATSKDMDTVFSLLHSDFIAHGIPVYVGEAGLLNEDDAQPGTIEHGEAMKYFEALGQDARANGVTLSYWDDGARILNRNTMQLIDPSMFAAMTTSLTTNSGNASSDMVFVPKYGQATAQSLTLNPDGTTFEGLYDGSTKLVAGHDYTLSGNRLTLTAALLARLTQGHGYGVAATLQARFSTGVPWSIDVRMYAWPWLPAHTGSTNSFSIPGQLSGDVLSTMQAVYANGSNAGSATWTSYKQYSTDFSADYANNSITLTPAFLNSLTDGAPVTLTFHLWSGATVTYHVTRHGTTVTGATD